MNEPIQAESPNRVVALASVAALAAVADLNASVAVQWSSAVGGNDHWYMCFRFVNSTPWSVAQSIAQSWGGHLATITSAEENQFVYDVSISQNGWTFFDQWVGPYLGARKNSANQFEWVTGEAFTYASWLPGEPSSGLWEPNLMFLGGAPFTTNIGPYWNDVDDSQLSAVFEFSTAPLPAPGAIVLTGFAGLTSRRRRTP